MFYSLFQMQNRIIVWVAWFVMLELFRIIMNYSWELLHPEKLGILFIKKTERKIKILNKQGIIGGSFRQILGEWALDGTKRSTLNTTFMA